MPTHRILFVAGDPSGDVHTAPIISRLRQVAPDCDCFGVGGSRMAAAGFRPLLPFEPFACMGFIEVLRNLPFLLRARVMLTNQLRRERPDALVLVDYASFNLPLLRTAHRLGVPTVWYIAPKVWAWKRKRAEVIGECATSVGVIFPFEAPYFEGRRASVEFVGNPLVEALDARGGQARPDLLASKPSTFHKLALVPGSRTQEVRTMLPSMLTAYGVLRRSYRQMRAVVSKVSWLPPSLYAQAAATSGVEITEAPLSEVLETCDVAAVTSGTATLETALRGIPHVIVYRTSELSYRIYKALITVKHIGLPNIVAGETIVPECIQERAHAADIAGELDPFLRDRDTYRATVRRLLALREQLGGKRPSHEVANMILAAARGRAAQ